MGPPYAEWWGGRLHKGQVQRIALRTHLVGDGGGAATHFKALRGQVPVGPGALACQLHAGALILFHDLAQAKVLQRHRPSSVLR